MVLEVSAKFNVNRMRSTHLSFDVINSGSKCTAF